MSARKKGNRMTRNIVKLTKKQLGAIRNIAACKGNGKNKSYTHMSCMYDDGTFAAFDTYHVIVMSGCAIDDTQMDEIKNDDGYCFKSDDGSAGKLPDVRALFNNYNDYIENGDNRYYTDDFTRRYTADELIMMCKNADRKDVNGKSCFVSPMKTAGVNATYMREVVNALGAKESFVSWSMSGIIVECDNGMGIIMPIRI